MSSASRRSSSSRLNLLGKIERSGHVELLHRRAIVQQRQQLDLRRSQIHNRGLHVGLVLHPLQFQPLIIHLRDVAGLQPVVAHCEQAVVIRQILPRQIQHRLLLQRLHERAPQIEQQVPLLIGVLRHGDRRPLLRALPPQFALVLPLVQVADGSRRERVGERTVDVRAAVGRRLRRERIDLIHGAGQVGIGPQIRRDLLRARFVDADLGRPQRRIVGLKTVANLLAR